MRDCIYEIKMFREQPLKDQIVRKLINVSEEFGKLLGTLDNYPYGILFQ